MEDTACVAFLQWALPRLGLRWAGFRRVRRQVGKRVDRRLRALGLADVAAYRAYLETHADEWRVLDGLCRIPISRFWRDRGVYAHLGEVVLPELARAATARGERRVRCWSAGCASGEEPYSLALAWALAAARRSPPVTFEVVATDADTHLLERARAARYAAGSLKELPPGWRARAFTRSHAHFTLRAEFRDRVALLRQDVCEEAPPGRFDLVLCRNMAFTYFAEPGQRAVLQRIAGALVAGGMLVIGAHERLPADAESLVAPWTAKPGVYRKRAG
ncbi:MAG: CheR family methyltransferase [Alphaproteobacteria bacterium]